MHVIFGHTHIAIQALLGAHVKVTQTEYVTINGQQHHHGYEKIETNSGLEVKAMPLLQSLKMTKYLNESQEIACHLRINVTPTHKIFFRKGECEQVFFSSMMRSNVGGMKHCQYAWWYMALLVIVAVVGLLAARIRCSRLVK